MATSASCRKIRPEFSPYPANSDWTEKPRVHREPIQRGPVLSFRNASWLRDRADKPIRVAIPTTRLVQGDEDKFRRLAAEWQQSSGALSSVNTVAMHPSYQQMIGMGKEALPLIFERLKLEGDEPNHWFWALAAITTENPVPKESRGRIAEMAKAWLEWGSKRGYVQLD